MFQVVLQDHGSGSGVNRRPALASPFGQQLVGSEGGIAFVVQLDRDGQRPGQRLRVARHPARLGTYVP